jgi:hypothetical protein
LAAGNVNEGLPLSWAAGNGNEAVIRLLLENGANLESRDDGGRTPLSWAAQNGHEAVTKLLLKKGANPESKDDGGRTPLSWAADRGRKTVVELLLEKGADLESKDSSGRTPLSWAAAHAHDGVVQLLLEKGANANHIIASPAGQPNKDDYYQWKHTVFGSEYMIWHDGLPVGAVKTLTGDARLRALRMLFMGVELGDSHAATALASMGDASATAEMRAQLRQSTGESKVNFALAINGLSPDDSLASELIEVLNSPSDQFVQMSAAIGLRQFSDSVSERALLDAVEQNGRYLVRYHASESLLQRWHVIPSGIVQHQEIFQLIRSPDADVTTAEERARLSEAAVLLERLRKQES